jgi:hypothetical protein
VISIGKVTAGDVTADDVIAGDVTAGDVTAGDVTGGVEVMSEGSTVFDLGGYSGDLLGGLEFDGGVGEELPRCNREFWWVEWLEDMEDARTNVSY